MLILLGVILVLSPCEGFLWGFTMFENCSVADPNCHNNDIKFLLYNRNFPESPVFLTQDNVMDATFESKSSLIILIHGYTGDKNYSPNMELRPVFLSRGHDVLTVDWGPLAQPPCYVHAASNTDTVGLCTAQLLSKLFATKKISREESHVIGFSLGAHVAGAVGKYLKELSNMTLPWITGLDPALPLFDILSSRRNSRLDEGDADFVDVIHTNAGIKGKLSPMGHVDFYMNGAAFQPGCNKNSSCDHVRAVEYYAESVGSTRGFWGSPCFLNEASFLLKLSPDLCVTDSSSKPVLAMGPKLSHRARGTYHVLTNSKPPFALGKMFLLGSINSLTSQK